MAEAFAISAEAFKEIWFDTSLEIVDYDPYGSAQYVSMPLISSFDCDLKLCRRAGRANQQGMYVR